MIRIAVCDDDPRIVQCIHKYLIEKHASLSSETLDISTYESGEDFLRDTEDGHLFHIVFMDIQMQNISGLEVGELLRKKPEGDDVIMIYISHHDSYFEDLVQIGSFRFLKKPIDEAHLDTVFTRALHLAMKYKTALEIPSLFQFKIGAEIHTVSSDTIAYLKNEKRIIELHVWNLEDKTIGIINKFYSKMDAVLEKLPREKFIRSERSHIVNFQYVRRMAKDSFILTDKRETRIPIGRAYKDSAKKAYFKYMEESVWRRALSK